MAARGSRLGASDRLTDRGFGGSAILRPAPSGGHPKALSADHANVPHKRFTLAHDAGTGGSKAVLTELQGQIAGSSYQAHAIHYPQTEWAEQDPAEVWGDVAATSRQVIDKSGIDPA